MTNHCPLLWQSHVTDPTVSILYCTAYIEKYEKAIKTIKCRMLLLKHFQLFIFIYWKNKTYIICMKITYFWNNGSAKFCERVKKQFAIKKELFFRRNFIFDCLLLRNTTTGIIDQKSVLCAVNLLRQCWKK